MELEHLKPLERVRCTCVAMLPLPLESMITDRLWRNLPQETCVIESGINKSLALPRRPFWSLAKETSDGFPGLRRWDRLEGVGRARVREGAASPPLGQQVLGATVAPCPSERPHRCRMPLRRRLFGVPSAPAWSLAMNRARVPLLTF